MTGTLVRDIVFILIYLTVLVADNSCPNCRHNKCDDNNECLQGCKRGFAGSKCIHECSSNCVHSKCYLNVNTGAYPCLIGCNPGYHGYQCNAPCTGTDKEGKCDRFTGTSPDCDGISYGTNCEASCSSMCDGFMCDNTGKCLDKVCIPGRYGAWCEKVCESKCQLCHKDTGECLLLESKELLYDCKCSCDTTDSSHGYFVFLGIITFLLLVNVIVNIIQTRYQSQRRNG